MRVLIVEDEILVAMELEETLEELGHEVVGIAPDRESALALASAADIDVALVDINLRDGETGVDIGRRLVANDAAVVFVTANAALVADGVPGAIGVMPKPATRAALAGAVDYAGMCRMRTPELPAPPVGLQLFG